MEKRLTNNNQSDIPEDHPRYLSLKERHKIIDGMHKKIVAEAGLIAHGRGEAFDYILGEKTPNFALEQEKAALALLYLAERPIFSVNGNVAVLCPKEIVKLVNQIDNAKLEVNLFYRTLEREKNIKNQLISAGAKEEDILGVNLGESAESIPEISHNRRVVDPEGIYLADVVFVPLEDGDRTMALRKMGKKVITVDLNPMSRTAIWSNITIVNHIRRAMQEMVRIAQEFKELNTLQLQNIVNQYDNNEYLQRSVKFMSSRLLDLANSELQENMMNKKRG